MTLIEELTLFVKSILHWIYAFLGFTFFFFLFGLHTDNDTRQEFYIAVIQRGLFFGPTFPDHATRFCAARGHAHRD